MSFQIYFQHDSMQCGLACLQMICKHYGKEYTLEHISRLCPPLNDGISLYSLGCAGEDLGFDISYFSMTIGDLLKQDTPCILHWDGNHYVVLYKTKGKNTFYIADPDKGFLQYSESELAKHWYDNSHKGIIMTLKPTIKFYQNKTSNHGKAHSLKFLLTYINQYKACFIQIIAGLLLGSILQLIMPFLTQSVVDLGIHYEDIKLIWLILTGELVIVISKALTDFFRRWILLHISMRINISLISDFFIKLLNLPMRFFDNKHVGDFVQRMTDHGRVQTFLTSYALNLTFSIFSFIILGIVLLIYNSSIFLIFLTGSVLSGIWISFFLKKRKTIDFELFHAQAKTQNKTYQFITGIQEIKLQNCENRRRGEWEDAQANLFCVQMKSLKLQQSQEAGNIFINELKNILITIFAATAVINNSISLGAMLAIQYIVGQLNSPVEQFVDFIYSLQDVKLSLERINEIHDLEEEDYHREIKSFKNLNRDIILKDICFKYDTSLEKNILDHVSITIPSNKVTAIVGASGSGKTTLIKLILGYYPVMSGHLFIGDRDINEYNLKWWRQHCGVVMQDGIIFSESIAHNIAIDDGDIDKKRLEKAAKIANIHDHIMRLPLKYNTQIGRDGIGISQGQKQRILIARAVYKNPDFIFLDEATNALDAKNERAIVENLDEFYKGRTVVVVAHRLSTVKNADQIIVLDGGKVVETGNHISLIDKKGSYYNLVKNQLELGN